MEKKCAKDGKHGEGGEGRLQKGVGKRNRLKKAGSGKNGEEEKKGESEKKRYRRTAEVISEGGMETSEGGGRCGD